MIPILEGNQSIAYAEEQQYQSRGQWITNDKPETNVYDTYDESEAKDSDISLAMLGKKLHRI